MRTATLSSPLCFMASVEDNPIRQQGRWRRNRTPPLDKVLSDGRLMVHCNVASSRSPENVESSSVHNMTDKIISPLTSSVTCRIREARLEDIWQIADTHCSTFMPDQGLVMDFALRFDRMMAVVGSFLQDQKKCLVAVEEDSLNVFDSEFFSLPFHTPFMSNLQVSGILTIDNVGEFLPRRRPSGRRRTGTAYVSNVAVRYESRRKGIAKRLLKESERLARSWGCRSIALHCDARNTGAVALYIAEGYKVIKIPQNAKWPEPKGLPGSSFLLLMKSLVMHDS